MYGLSAVNIDKLMKIVAVYGKRRLVIPKFEVEGNIFFFPIILGEKPVHKPLDEIVLFFDFFVKA